MKFLLIIIFVAVSFLGCSTDKYQEGLIFTFHTKENNQKLLSKNQLDRKALKYLSKQWDKPIEELKCRLVQVQNIKEISSEGILLLLYDCGMGPGISVVFSRYGEPIRWKSIR